VEPYSDVARAEPRTDAAGVAPAAQLWSTASELARWGSFLAEPDPTVLAPATLEEMCELTVMADAQRWSLGLGLGLMLYRRDGGIFIGHGGAMPGFLAGLLVDRESKSAAAVLTATGVGADAETLAAQLIEDSLDADPRPITPWTPGTTPPAEVVALLGRWWTEGNELVISWHDRLEARLVGAPDWRPPAVFVRLADDDTGERWRTESGREAGELLRVTRGSDGSVTAMSWATYALTRHPAAFTDLMPPA
jgi:CubicO group peptidase (beta-lactamase class C family)